ncbi:hypothetical protein SAMN05216228_102481 [Rhizobium tibeticum]|uniref:Uncharacterized protein n=1 Tax=Rhizobium tibeticum TaxID=501024 RepID=A0A1H8SF40_9HYPH|nr:hypothetical protein [Rhizobium tibeticum]SEI12453.1 hypothetical protein RTCCBAU85039_4818 [Rhizobium tibeticum]SEO77195.1 hypothetical protein SAMN05216228_102481 [Rhizobium tibeticum]
MRTQQRRFVVEVKSSRRRSTVAPKSIWGDTDFKALVREAKAETEHLFVSPKNDVAVPSDSAEIGQDKQPEFSVTNDHGTDQPKPPQVLSLDAVFETQRKVDDAASRSGASAENAGPTRRVARVTKRQRTVKRDLRALSTADASLNEARDLVEEVDPDVLAVLDAENRRLKGILRQRLVEQNKKLRTMLERFDLRASQ